MNKYLYILGIIIYLPFFYIKGFIVTEDVVNLGLPSLVIFMIIGVFPFFLKDISNLTRILLFIILLLISSSLGGFLSCSFVSMKCGWGQEFSTIPLLIIVCIALLSLFVFNIKKWILKK